MQATPNLSGLIRAKLNDYGSDRGSICTVDKPIVSTLCILVVPFIFSLIELMSIKCDGSNKIEIEKYLFYCF